MEIEVLVFFMIAIFVFVLIIFYWMISISNKINRLKIKIREADSDIDVALIKRYDVLTKMVKVVKSYAKHEKEIIIETIKIRKGMSLNEKRKINNEMDDKFKKLEIVAENYPELKSSDNYKLLQQSILEVEEHLQAARRLYNSNVSIFNQLIVSFPSSVIASLKNVKGYEFFEVEENKKEDVKIDL